MKPRMLFIMVVALLIILFIGIGMKSKNPEKSKPAKSSMVPETIPVDDLPDITRIEGIGIQNGYAYFLYRKGTKNYLGKMKIEEAVEVTVGK